MPSNAWQPSSAPKTRREWLKATAAVYSAQNEILVLITETGHAAAYPEVGRTLRMQGIGMVPEPYRLAHEIGHYLGLRHTWEIDGVDAETLSARKMADKWDLVYKPGTSAGNPHTFYTDFASAYGPSGSNEPNLEFIQKRPCDVHCTSQTSCTGHPSIGGDLIFDSCVEDGSSWGTLTCHVGESPSYSENYTNGDWPLLGLATTSTAGNAINAMSYRGNFKDSPYFLSASQVLVLRKYLRWDVPITENLAAITQDRNTAYPYTPAGRRPRLGSWSFRDPQAKLDFNGDGRRDVGVWIPPAAAGPPGRLVVLLSPSYSTTAGSYIDTNFGRLGDIPVPADYDSDGKTDFAVFQPGGGADRADPTSVLGYWRWCITQNSNPASTNCSGISQTTCPAGSCLSFGAREDTPTPGLEFDGALPNELAFYRPSTGTWFWLPLGGTASSRTIGTANVGSIPLPGNYDTDLLADLVVWDPDAGKYWYRRSQSSWNTQGSVVFGSSFVASPSGTSAQRSLALPMPGYTLSWDCSSGLCIPYRTNTFTIWWAHDGTWRTVSDPFGVGAIDSSCTYGLNRADQPFSGFDRNGDNVTDYGIYRANSWFSGWLHTRSRSVGSCSGTNVDTYCSNCNVRTRVFAVSDMTGDGHPELMLLFPENTRIEWRTSESGYATVGGSWTINDHQPVVL